MQEIVTDLLEKLSLHMVSSPPITMGAQIFLDLNYLGVSALNFFRPGGESHLGGTKIYLGGISP